MVSNKVSKSTRESRARRSALAAPRRRVHSLAPEHVGEVGSVAALAVAVFGVAFFILAITLVVGGLTIGGRFAGGTEPPNLGSIGLQMSLAGGGLVVYSLVVIAAPVALLADVRRARLVTVLIAALTTLACGGLLAYVLLSDVSEPVVLASLGVAIFVFGASTLILARPGR